MPSSTPELRKYIEDRYGSIDTHGPSNELERLGFVERRGCWVRIRPPNKHEWKLINFLIEEWDYGGYEED
jgi:hypothetical protein